METKMAHKTTPDKNDKRPIIDPRRLNYEEEPQNTNSQEGRRILPRKKKNYKQRDASTIAIVNPRMINRPPICQTYPPMYPLGYSPAMPAGAPIPHYAQPIITGYSYPDTRWNTFVNTLYNPLYSVPLNTVPVNPMPIPIYSPCTQGCPFNSPLLPEPPMYVIAHSSPMAASIVPNYNFNQSFESLFLEQSRSIQPPVVNNCYKNIDDEITKKIQTSPVRSRDHYKPKDPEYYLQLPKNLFPTARTIAMDPNPIIDVFCQLFDSKHSTWILDLEFGIPRQPVTRPIAIYDVQFNSIHCKNTPGAIHPGFESCNQDFKRVFLFYYDSVVSTWCKGFVIQNSDRSVANFQSWLQVPMQVFGMCWP